MCRLDFGTSDIFLVPSIPWSEGLNCVEIRDFNMGHRFAVGCLVSPFFSTSCVFLFCSWLVGWVVICEGSMVPFTSVPPSTRGCLVILNSWTIFFSSCCVDSTRIWGTGLSFFANFSGTFFLWVDCSPCILQIFWTFSSSPFCFDDSEICCCMVVSVAIFSKTLFSAVVDAPIWKLFSAICWTNGVITCCCTVPSILKWLSWVCFAFPFIERFWAVWFVFQYKRN